VRNQSWFFNRLLSSDRLPGPENGDTGNGDPKLIFGIGGGRSPALQPLQTESHGLPAVQPLQPELGKTEARMTRKTHTV
jgi:hypothetical protein